MQMAAYGRCRTLSPTGAGNTQVSISFGEKTDPESLRAAWQTVVARHGILRTSFTQFAGEMVTGKEVDSAGTDWTSIDWLGEAAEAVPTKWNALLAAEAARPFEPANLPLVRFHEIRLPGGNAHYLLTFPSFLLDEFSVTRVLADWLIAIGHPVAAEPVASILPSSGSLIAWKEILSGANEPLRLHPRPDQGVVAQTSAALGRDETASFTDFCETRNLERPVVLQCLWALVLRRFGATGNLSLALHSVRQGQEAGYFESWLPVAQTWEGAVGPWLLAAQKRHEAAKANAWINPVQALSATGRSLAIQDVPVSFAWRGEKVSDVIHSALPRWINFDARIIEAPPSGLRLEARDGIRLDLRVTGPSEFVARDLLSRITALIGELPDLFDKPLAKIPVLLPEEIHSLRMWARGPESVEHPESLTAAFHEVASNNPEAIAVQDGDYSLTFSMLDSLSDKLASHLAKAGLAGGWHVGLFLSSSSWVAVALLGTWKAGNLCVVLDSSVPKEWIESTLSSHDAGVVLCDALSAPLLDESSRRRIVLDQEWDTLETSDLPKLKIQADTPAVHLAGHSDGEAPIVRTLNHGQLLAASIEGARVLNFGPGDSFLAHSAPGGGAFFDEWMVPLLTGGMVALAGNDLLDPATAQVTHLRLTTPEWHNQAARWSHGEDLVSPTIRVVAVEAGSPRKAALDIWNKHAYGSLNTLVFFSPAGLCGLGVAAAARADGLNLTPGKPTPDVEVSVFDPNFHEMPPGYSGELVFRFPGWKKTGGTSTSRKGIVTGLRAWRNRAGDLFIESDVKRAPGIPDAAARRASEALLGNVLDAYVGAHSWVLADSAPAGLLAVPEWPLTRGGWIAESLLPAPAKPIQQAPKPAAPAKPSPAARPWNPITVLQEKGDAPTLVLLPSAAGTPDIYRDLAAAIGPTRRIIGLLARGFHNPEACHPTVESAAAAYIVALLEEDPTVSFVLAGYGFGGTVALEMVRQLVAAGRPAPELLLIGSTAPKAEGAGGWLSSVKSAFKRLSAPERMEPHADPGEPASIHEAAWKKYHCTYGNFTARIILPSDFSPDGAANWVTILPDATIVQVKCHWDEMLSFPAVKRLASILNNGE